MSLTISLQPFSLYQSFSFPSPLLLNHHFFIVFLFLQEKYFPSFSLSSLTLSHNFKVNFTYYLLGTKMVIQNMQSYLEGAEEGFIHRHHSSCIVKLSAVIWCWEQSDQLSLGEEFITIFNNLWGSDDSLDIEQYFVNIIIRVYHSILYVGFFLAWSIWKTH